MVALILALTGTQLDTARTYLLRYQSSQISGIKVQSREPGFEVLLKKGRKIIARGFVGLQISLSPGEYDLTVLNSGDKIPILLPENTLITVVIAPGSPGPDTTGSIRVISEPEQGTGTLRVYCNVSMANLFVDDLFTPKTYTAITEGEALNIQLPSGEHTVKITERGFKDWQARIMIYPDKITVVDAKLEPEE